MISDAGFGFVIDERFAFLLTFVDLASHSAGHFLLHQESGFYLVCQLSGRCLVALFTSSRLAMQVTRCYLFARWPSRRLANLVCASLCLLSLQLRIWGLSWLWRLFSLLLQGFRYSCALTVSLKYRNWGLSWP